MSWSIRIGTVQGVAIRVHALFLLTLVWAGWLGWVNGATVGSVLFGLVSICALFGCVLVHEIAHTKQALAAGIPVRRIMLLPVGGLAELRALPDDPRVELAIAGAGPLANLGLSLILGGLTIALAGPGLGHAPREWLTVAASPTPIGLFVYLTAANVALFLFNLLPVYPLDGGRILRSLLTLVISPLRASRITATLGRVLALGLGGVAVFGFPAAGLPANISLAALALFLFVSSRLESTAFDQRFRLRGLLVQSLLDGASEAAWTVSPANQLESVIASGVFSRQSVVPVTVGGRLVGLLTLGASRRAMRRPGLRHVAHAMRTSFPRLTSHDTLWEAHQLLTYARIGALPVVERGELKGLLTHRALHAAATGRDVDVRAAASVRSGARQLDDRSPDA